tara:strand:+ start:37 stop:627 length:591 start_codon:yes stop_codon:yes gene_type:complete
MAKNLLNLFERYDDIVFEIEVVNKKIRRLERLGDYGNKMTTLHEKRDRLHKKKDKLPIGWSDESRESFIKFKIDGINELGGRIFHLKNKEIRLREYCNKLPMNSHPLFSKFSKVVKKFPNGDEVWKCGYCSTIHERGHEIFEFDSVPSSEVKTYYLIKGHIIKDIYKKLKSMKKKSDIINLDLEEYKPNIIEKFLI